MVCNIHIRLDPRHQRNQRDKVCLKMGHSAHCRVRWWVQRVKTNTVSWSLVNYSLHLTRALILFFSLLFASCLFSVKDFLMAGLPGPRLLFLVSVVPFGESLSLVVSWLSPLSPILSSSSSTTNSFHFK